MAGVFTRLAPGLRLFYEPCVMREAHHCVGEHAAVNRRPDHRSCRDSGPCLRHAATFRPVSQ